MSDMNKVASRYIAMWNEPDAALRRKATADLFAPDAVHYTHDQEVRGHHAREERVTTAYGCTGDGLVPTARDRTVVPSRRLRPRPHLGAGPQPFRCQFSVRGVTVAMRVSLAGLRMK
ncbi:hypothetical protein [Streptomyces sp. NPDC005004]